MRYTVLLSTKCGAKSVNPANARFGSHARKPTPRRLRVFCSNSGIAWLPPMAALAPMAAEPMSSMRRCMDQYSGLHSGRLPFSFANPQAGRCDARLGNGLSLQASPLAFGPFQTATLPPQLVGVAAAIEIKRIVEMPLATNCFVIVVALRGG